MASPQRAFRAAAAAVGGARGRNPGEGRLDLAAEIREPPRVFVQGGRLPLIAAPVQIDQQQLVEEFPAAGLRRLVEKLLDLRLAARAPEGFETVAGGIDPVQKRRAKIPALIG